MGSVQLSKSIVVTGLLTLLVGGCSKSDDGAAGAGGSSGSGGTAGTISAGTGGGGGTGQGATGGATGSGGTSGFGGATAAGGNSGGASGDGGKLATGGEGGRGTGGGPATGGTTGTGGQGGRGTGGSPATGGTTGTGGQAGTTGQRSISFGTWLDAQAVMTAAQQLGRSLATPGSSQWQAKGDQHRTYHFAAASADEPYRLYVPTNWDGKTSLPLAMFLHGSGSNEST